MRYLLFFFFALAITLMAFRPFQEYTITGIVKDQNGAPLANVVVTETRSRTSTLTNGDGSFTLKVSRKNIVLKFQLAGYDKIEFSPNDITKSIDIQLKASERSLKEVEVKGYKTERKKDVIGSMVYLNGAAAPSRNANDLPKWKEGNICSLMKINISGKLSIRLFQYRRIRRHSRKPLSHHDRNPALHFFN